MAQMWHVLRDEVEFGPFNSEEIRAKATTGWLRQEDFVRLEGASAWSPASRLQGIQFAVPQSLAPINGRQTQRNLAVEVVFRIVAPLLEPQELQFVILMSEFELSLPSDSGAALHYKYSLRRGHSETRGKGEFTMSSLVERLPDAGLFQVSPRERVELTDLGHEFARWLKSHDFQSQYFESALGSWGDQPFDWRSDW